MIHPTNGGSREVEGKGRRDGMGGEVTLEERGGRREGWVTLDTPDQGLSVISCSKSRHCRAGHLHIFSIFSIKKNARFFKFF